MEENQRYLQQLLSENAALKRNFAFMERWVKDLLSGKELSHYIKTAEDLSNKVRILEENNEILRNRLSASLSLDATSESFDISDLVYENRELREDYRKLKKNYDSLLEKFNDATFKGKKTKNQIHRCKRKKRNVSRKARVIFIVFLIFSALSVFCYLLTTEILPFWTFHFIELSFFTFWLIVYIQDRRHRQTFENLFYIISSSVCIVLTVFVMFMEAIS